MKLLFIAAMTILSSREVFAQNTIQCEGGMEVKFERPIIDLPLGKVDAKLTNFPLALGNYATLSRLPVFSMLQIQVDTAYCGFSFILDSAGNGLYLFGASASCEGETRELSCEIL